jgi:hypothetical protein
MYGHTNNDEGIAYAWLVLTIFVILCGILIAYYYGVINMLLDGPNGDKSVGINHDILAGKQSEQSKRAIQFNIDFATNIPIMIVLSIFVFAIGRAIVVKKVP